MWVWGLPLSTGPLGLPPFGQGLRDWEVIRRARATCMKAMYLLTVSRICTASLFSYVDPYGQIAPSTLSILRAYDIFVHKQTSIRNWIAAEGQSWCHPGGGISAPPNCPPSCLLWLLRACHLCKPSFLAKLKRDLITSPRSNSVFIPAVAWTSLYTTHLMNAFSFM